MEVSRLKGKNQLAQQKLCISPMRPHSKENKITKPTSMGVSLCSAAATSVSIFNAAPNPVVYEVCLGKPKKDRCNNVNVN